MCRPTKAQRRGSPGEQNVSPEWRKNHEGPQSPSRSRRPRRQEPEDSERGLLSGATFLVDYNHQENLFIDTISPSKSQLISKAHLLCAQFILPYLGERTLTYH